jgi:hypothetical protein
MESYVGLCFNNFLPSGIYLFFFELILAFVLDNFLCVFSKGVAAFGASHELRHRFVSSAGLHHPNIDFPVTAFLTLLLDFGHRVDFVFLSNDRHESFRFRLQDLSSSCFGTSIKRLFCVAAFCAAEHKSVAFAGFFWFQT